MKKYIEREAAIDHFCVGGVRYESGDVMARRLP